MEVDKAQKLGLELVCGKAMMAGAVVLPSKKRRRASYLQLSVYRRGRSDAEIAQDMRGVKAAWFAVAHSVSPDISLDDVKVQYKVFDTEDSFCEGILKDCASMRVRISDNDAKLLGLKDVTRLRKKYGL